MFSDADRAKDVFITSAHLWFFENVETNRAVEILTDGVLKPLIFITIFL